MKIVGKPFIVFVLAGGLILTDCFRFIPFFIHQAYALNLVNNSIFASNSTGWTVTNGSANATAQTGCGNTTDSTTSNIATFAYDGALSSQTAFKAISGATKGTDYRGNINQTVTAPGSGTVNVSGKLSYYGNSTAWGAGLVSLEIWNSTNSTYVGSLGCVAMSANTAWTTTSLSSNVSLTGGTTYTIRVNFVVKTKSNSNTAITLGVDNVYVDFAPTGVSVSAPAGTTNAALSWTSSTAGSGANGLNATTPYKVYRNTSSPVSTFLANATTNSYTDSTTIGNTTYYYAVSDVDTTSIESPLSAEISLLTLPGAPTALTFTNVKDSTLTLSWTAPTGGASSYKIERCQGSGCSNFVQIASGVLTTSYNDSGLTGGTIYQYRIRATNTTGDGGYSSTGNVTTGIVSITITTNGTVTYGVVTKGSQKSTIDLVNTQTAKNTGNVAEDFNITSSNATNGTSWVLGSSAGTDIFVHEFSTNSGSTWTSITTAGSYLPLASNIAVNSTQNFDLRITLPTVTSDNLQKTITVTIQAVAH